MKKKVLFVFPLMIALLWMSACGAENRDSISAVEFANRMAVHSFYVTDITDEFETEEITSAQIAAQEDGDYQIEFQVFPRVSQAKDFFSSNKAAMQTRKVDDVKGTSVTVANYEEYSLTSDGVYYYMARIDDTVLYVMAYTEYENEIKSYIEELGYYN